MAAQKIAVYSISDLKNTTDDALPNYLNSLKFKQSHYLTDVRLTLGYVAVIIAGATFAADYKLGWDATKAATFWAVLVYFILNTALTLWIWLVEKGIVFEGERDGVRLSIASQVTKYTPIYKIKIEQHSSQNSASEVVEYSAPFTLWFDADGHFIAKPFQQWLASVVPAIGQADSAHSATKPAQNTKEDGKTSSNDVATPSKKRGRPKKE